jgi:hypothetical protein
VICGETFEGTAGRIGFTKFVHEPRHGPLRVFSILGDFFFPSVSAKHNAKLGETS